MITNFILFIALCVLSANIHRFQREGLGMFHVLGIVLSQSAHRLHLNFHPIGKILIIPHSPNTSQYQARPQTS